jgi:hypothetical protein
LNAFLISTIHSILLEFITQTIFHSSTKTRISFV